MLNKKLYTACHKRNTEVCCLQAHILPGSGALLKTAVNSRFACETYSWCLWLFFFYFQVIFPFQKKKAVLPAASLFCTSLQVKVFAFSKVEIQIKFFAIWNYFNLYFLLSETLLSSRLEMRNFHLSCWRRFILQEQINQIKQNTLCPQRTQDEYNSWSFCLFQSALTLS